MASHYNHILVIMKWLGEVLVKSKFKAAVALSSYKKKATHKYIEFLIIILTLTTSWESISIPENIVQLEKFLIYFP